MKPVCIQLPKQYQKFNRFWRLHTHRATHFCVADNAMPGSLLRRAWLARLLNETVIVEFYNDRTGWQTVLRCPARELPVYNQPCPPTP